MIRRSLPFLLACLLFMPVVAAAQDALPLGSMVSATAGDERPARFVFEAAGPGFLTVVIRGPQDEGDLYLTITDDEDQTLPSGMSDSDVDGNTAAEQIVVQIPWAGTFGVIVASHYGFGQTPFELGATFLATEAAARDPDPDAKPSQARALASGESHEDSIDPPAGDGWDWYAITASAGGTLTVLTRATSVEEGDLALEVYRAGEFQDAVDRSDQDADGVLTNESITIDVSAGETVYLKVMPSFAGGAVAYRIASGLIGE